MLHPVPVENADEVSHSSKAFVKSGLEDGLTPQQIADHNERTERQRKRPLREVKSAFFPPSTHFQSTETSPYRRATLASANEDSGVDVDPEPAQVKVRDMTLRSHTSKTGRRLPSGTGSESTYSRSSSGRTPRPYGSAFCLSKSESNGEPGTAVIITSRPAYFDPTIAPSIRRRHSSAKSSEWKGWMASQVAHLEDHATDEIEVYDAYPVRESYHRRENAQLDGDDSEIRPRRASDLARKQPLAALHINAASRPPLQRKVSDTMVERFPLLEKRPAIRVNTTEEHSPVSVAGTARLQRKPSNIENKKIQAAEIQFKPSTIHQKTSQVSLRSEASLASGHRALADSTKMNGAQAAATPGSISSRGKLHTRSTANMHSHHSPDRAARLRRIKTANTLQLRAIPLHHQHHQQENQAINDLTPVASPRDDYDIFGTVVSEPITTDSQTVGSQKMVDLFLSERRKDMRISEESGVSPAFL